MRGRSVSETCEREVAQIVSREWASANAKCNFKNDGDGQVFVYMTNRKTVVAPYERRRWGVGSDRVDSLYPTILIIAMKKIATALG